MEPTDWAYLAGVIDGEGCITSYFNASGSCYIRIRISQVNYPIIKWLEDHLRGHTWKCSAGKWSPGKARYVWGCEGRQARDILKGVYPYLTYKKPQARVAYFMHQVPKERRVKLHELLRALKQRER